MTESFEDQKRKKHKEMLQYLNEFIKLKLGLIPYNEKANRILWNEGKTFPANKYIEQDELLAQVIWAINRMNKSGTVSKKKMPNGKFRIYTHFTCCGTVEHFLKCPEQECAVDNSTKRCPHFPEVINKDYIHTIRVKT